MTVGEMTDRMSADELNHWMALSALEAEEMEHRSKMHQR